VVATVLAFFLLTPEAAGQPPQPPCWFYGTVSIDGQPAQAGQNVTASIRGTDLNWTTLTVNGTYGWPQKGSVSFYLPYDNSTTLIKDGGEDGDTIEFYINGTKTAQNATYQSMETIRVNIFIGAPPDLTPPGLSVILPENKTYTQNDIELVFTVNETASWIAYSLDGKTNQTILGNETLSTLPTGSHGVIVYAKDAAGNEGASEPRYFNIETASPATFPPWIIATFFSAVVLSAMALGLFLRRQLKNKHSRRPIGISQQYHGDRSIGKC
jgi:hypothetical protein